MSESKWWNKQLRIVQYNLQMKDTPLMDPEKIARETQEMYGDVVVINVADSVVWYNTAVKYQKINPYLPENRDILQELIDAFHKRDIKVIARGAFMAFEEETYYQKPEWAKRQPDGSPVMLGNSRPGEWYRLYVPCPNSGFMSQGGGLDVAKEAFAKYDLDGAFWLGGVGWGNDCWCDNCKRLYREMTGEEMPGDKEQIDPRWNYAAARKSAVSFYQSLLEVKPDMPYLRYYWPFDMDIGLDFCIPADNIDDIATEGNVLCTEAQDVLSLSVLKLPEWHTPALRMKMGRTIEGFPPPVGIIHSSPGMDWRHTCMPEAEFMYWASQIPANGGSYWTTFTGFCDTTPDKRMIRAIGNLNAMTARIVDSMENAKSDCQVILLSDGGIYVQGWAEALLCAHIDFDMLAHYQLSYQRIKDYPVVILPKDFKHIDRSAEIFTQYVENGGHLIVEGTADADLAPVYNLLGIEGPVVCSEDLVATYLRIEPSDAGIQELVGACDLVPLRGKVGYCHSAKDSRVLATWVPSFASMNDAGRPPERASLPQPSTDIPLCVVSRHKKGKVMFLPYEPSRLIREYAIRDLYTMLDAYVSYMLGERKKITVAAPSRVMATVFCKDNTQMIHLVNGIGQRPLQDTVPCSDLTLTLKLEGKTVRSVVSQIAQEAVEYAAENDVLTIRLPRLAVWDMLLVEFA